MHSEEVPQKEVKEILKTLQYIRGLTEQGKKEMAHMWNYIGAFGFYLFVGSFAGVIFNEWRVWVWALPFAFFFSTGPHLGWLKSFITWSVISGIVVLLAKVLSDALLFMFLLIVLAFLGFSFLYGTLKEHKRRGKAFTVAPRIGAFWGILMGGVAVNIVALSKVPGMDQAAINSILWPFAAGVGYLITGFFTAKEFVYIGLLLIFGSPIVFVVAPQLSFAFLGVIGLLIGILGIKLMLYQKKEEKEVETA